MTKFEDGPAKGAVLYLRRAPLFLRVVCDPEGKCDALDQLHDTPAANESIVLYRLVKYDGYIHINSRDKKANTMAVGSRWLLID